MTAFDVAMLILAPLPWWGLYRLDRRCAIPRGAGDTDAKGKGAGGADTTRLGVADRRPRAPDQADSALGLPGLRSPM